MVNAVKVGIIGDYNENTVSQPAINDALEHSAAALSVQVTMNWLPTESFLNPEGRYKLEDYDAYWVASGDPQNIEGVLTGIRIARETGKPLIGT